MTELERMKERMPTRRGFLTGTLLGGLAGTISVNVAVEGGAVAVEHAVLTDHTIDPISTPTPSRVLADMPDNPIARARDIYAETGGINRDWWEKARRAGVMEYATRIRVGESGRQVIVSHGGGLVLWGEDAPERMVGVPLDEQPDRKFARFVDGCMFEARMRQDPALHARRAETFRKGFDTRQRLEYYAWTASDGEEAVSVALTLDQVAASRSRARSRPGTVEESRPLLSHDATTPCPSFGQDRHPLQFEAS